MEVFWCQGYEATSLQDLLTAMGISKSSFYQAFGSKHNLFERCLALYREQQVERMQAALDKSESGRAFLRSALHSAVAEAQSASAPRACLIMNTATEFAGRDPGVASHVADSTRAFAGVFEAAVRRAQQEGDIAPERNAETLAHYMITTVTGMKTLVKAGLPAAAVEEIAEVALTTLR